MVSTKYYNSTVCEVLFVIIWPTGFLFSFLTTFRNIFIACIRKPHVLYDFVCMYVTLELLETNDDCRSQRISGCAEREFRDAVAPNHLGSTLPGM